ncbi:DUF1631 domain-containing protein [Marinicella litoralis]|uniref:Uncharacterized protein DUF1631 n=1 Tax=Marinicella litoralis TaxID=644220 RepID=A0A4R6XW42_9GAMM|nr:DUF1631 domain-containing protein [Marinicella litoralis]TDR22454.1 uncharacterized protein DUF1631 [Marinicella litoralis]
MKTEKPVNNITHISPELKEKISQGRILPKVHKLFLKGLKPAIRDYYDNLDDSLFDMAEKAENNETQSDYFTAMREVRKKKELMVRKFSENIQDTFKKFKKADFNYFSESSSQVDSSANNMSLVDEHELDQNLAITNMIDKANTYLHQNLFAFKKRFSLLAGGSELNNDQVPVSPSVIVKSFSNTFVHVNISNKVELIMLKLFERNLIPNLGKPYQEINEYLIEEGIYPNLKFQVPKRANQSASPTHSQATQGGLDHGMENNEAYATNNQPQISDDNFRIISAAFNNRQASMINQVSNLPVYESAIINNALSALQHEELQNLNSRQISMSPIEIKDELLNRLKQTEGGTKKQVNKQDEDTIDLVGMLFQFLVEDRNLPHRLQALLAKLQIPYLHIALDDRKLFSNKENNARKLLDIIAQASVGWTEETDVKGNFINKVEEIIQNILETDYQEINFPELIEDFQAFLKKHEKRANILEKRTSEKALGQERILKAKEKTAAILQAKMKNHSLPKSVSDLLLTPWANVLILAHLRHQDEPELVENYAKFVDKLIFVSIQNKKKQATNAQISHVIDHLSKGLRLVAFDEHSIKEKSKELYQLLLTINGIETEDTEVEHEFILPQEAFKVSEDNSENKPEIVHFIADKKFNNLNTTIEHHEDEYYQKAKNLVTGDWVEFIAENDEDIIRAKLSWVSPISQKLLFVNARGVKVTDKSLDELAHDLREKSAMILQQIPIFDRALDAIAKQMTDKNNEQQTSETESINSTQVEEN